MTNAPLDLDALEALRDEMFAAMRAANPGEFSIRQMNAEEKYDDAIRNAAPALIAATRERDTLREALEASKERLDWLSAQGGTHEVLEFIELSIASISAALSGNTSACERQRDESTERDRNLD